MTDLSQRHPPESRQREILEKLFSNTKLSTFEMFRNFPVFTPRFNLARFLLHYELFKRIQNLPGVIVDLGVFQGSSTFTWAKLCEIFCPTDVKKVVYGFDSFTGFPSLSSEDTTEGSGVDLRVGGFAGGDSIEKDLELAYIAMKEDKHIKHINRIQLIKGDVDRTIPDFVRSQGNGLKIALLNLDLDLYQPTRIALEHLVPRMIKGGIIVADEYADKKFGGETKAIDEYFQEILRIKPAIKKFAWHSNPSAYIEVDW